MTIRAIARTFRRSRRKVREALASPEPQPYTRTKDPPAPRLGPFKAVIEEILVADLQAPRKQRHTAAQIFRRLQAEHHYTGGYDQVRRYVGKHRRDQRETFIPLVHDPGQRLECDFGHIYVDFPEARRQIPVFLCAWSYSNMPFALAMPTERTEAILAGMVAAFDFFACVPREVWWDNPKTVVAAILKGRERKPHARYAALASHYAFEPLFCMPARGNEKPYVENRVYDLQRRFATPVPRVKDLAELNAYLRDCCVQEQQRRSAGHCETIAQRFAGDRAAASPLPTYPFDPCIHQAAVVDKYQTIRFDGNGYSVPRHLAFQPVTIKAYTDHLEVVAQGHVAARHARCYAHSQQMLDPIHYLASLGRRPAALDHSGVYRNWRLPAEFATLRATLEQQHGAAAGARQFIRVLQLLAHHPVQRVQRAIELCGSNAPSAERIMQHVFRLAERPAESAAPGEDVDPADPIMAIRVNLPDLHRFDELLSRGEPAYA